MDDMDEVISIEFIGFQPTMDIEVDSDDHLFYANNILTHNSAVQEQDHDHSHIAGGISKIQTADNVISIYGSTAMKERGQYQVQFLKTRSSSGVGSKVMLAFDPNTLRISDADESDASSAAPSTADVFADLRRKNGIMSTEDKSTAVQQNNKITDLSSLTALVRR